MLREQLLVEEGQLDRVGDLLDLLVEATDVRIGDVGHLFEHQLFDLGTRQLLEQQARAWVHQQGVAGTDPLAPEPLGQLGDALLVGASDDERAVVVEELLQRDDLSGEIGTTRQHDVEALVEHDLGALVERFVVELGMERDTDLAATGEDVGGSVVVAGEEGAVCRRWLRELVDLLAERGDVLARFPQRVGQLLVLGDRLGQLALGLEQALLEGAHALGSVLEAAAQCEDLLLHCGDVVTQLRQLGQLGLVDGDHLLGTLRGTLHPPPCGSARMIHGFPLRLPC